MSDATSEHAHPSAPTTGALISAGRHVLHGAHEGKGPPVPPRATALIALAPAGPLDIEGDPLGSLQIGMTTVTGTGGTLVGQILAPQAVCL